MVVRTETSDFRDGGKSRSLGFARNDNFWKQGAAQEAKQEKPFENEE
jgi:hypothetical protein